MRTRAEEALRGPVKISGRALSRRSALALFVRRLCLSKTGQYLLWWKETLLSETRSLLGRIRTPHGRRKGPAGICCGPLLEEQSDGHLLLSRSTNARSESIEAIYSRYPWAGEGDVMLVLAGWDMGSEFARRTSGTKSMDTGMS